MKKIIIALVLVSGLAIAGEYSVNVPVEKLVTSTNVVTATTAVVETIHINLTGTEATYKIKIALKDSNGIVLSKKTVDLTHAQMQALMPSIDDVMTGCRAVITANIAALLAM